MTKTSRLCLTTLLLISPCAPPVAAQSMAGTNLAVPSATAPAGAAIRVMAQDLFALGMAGKDALAVLAAARLAASVSVTDAATASIEPGRIDLAAVGQTLLIRKQDAAATAPAPLLQRPTVATPAGKTALFSATADAQGSGTGPATTADMLDAAQALAGEEETLLSLIDAARTTAALGGNAAALRRPSTVSAGMGDLWEIPFFGGAPAEIGIIGDGDSNLDMMVTDENGNVLCSDVGATDTALCRFTPSWNGYFTVLVQNRGTVANSYDLLTN